MIRRLDQHVRETTGRAGVLSSLALLAGGQCPAGWQMPFGVSESVVYRSTARSITRRCNHCGLLWTMTVHQLAKSARRRADVMRESGDEYAAVQECLADQLEQWAASVGGSRGREKAGS
jgi:hypothetical protein